MRKWLGKLPWGSEHNQKSTAYGQTESRRSFRDWISSTWQSHIDELHRSVADPNSGALVDGRRGRVGPGFEAALGSPIWVDMVWVSSLSPTVRASGMGDGCVARRDSGDATGSGHVHRRGRGVGGWGLGLPSHRSMGLLGDRWESEWA